MSKFSQVKESYWNHRVVKQTIDGEDWYSVREVFYNADGSIYAYTDNPVDVSGESVESMREYVQWILNCLDKPILVDGKVAFVEPEDSRKRTPAKRKKHAMGH